MDAAFGGLEPPKAFFYRPGTQKPGQTHLNLSVEKGGGYAPFTRRHYAPDQRKASLRLLRDERVREGTSDSQHRLFSKGGRLRLLNNLP